MSIAVTTTETCLGAGPELGPINGEGEGRAVAEQAQEAKEEDVTRAWAGGHRSQVKEAEVSLHAMCRRAYNVLVRVEAK